MKRLLRFSALFAVFASVGFASSQDLNKKITYRTTAVPIKRAIKEIDKLADVGLDVATPILGEIVVIDVKDVTVGDLLKRIATVTSCRWRKINGVMMLERTTDMAKEEEVAEQKLKMEAIKKSIKKLMEPVDKNPVMDAKLADEVVANQKGGKLSESMGSGNVAAMAQSAKTMLTQ